MIGDDGRMARIGWNWVWNYGGILSTTTSAGYLCCCHVYYLAFCLLFYFGCYLVLATVLVRSLFALSWSPTRLLFFLLCLGFLSRLSDRYIISLITYRYLSLLLLFSLLTKLFTVLKYLLGFVCWRSWGWLDSLGWGRIPSLAWIEFFHAIIVCGFREDMEIITCQSGITLPINGSHYWSLYLVRLILCPLATHCLNAHLESSSSTSPLPQLISPRPF